MSKQINTIETILPINTATFNNESINAVSARSLHTFLGVGKIFAAWMPEQIETFGFVEHVDFEVFSEIGNNPQGGRPSIEYLLSIPMAKELSMVSRTKKGKEARLYFIECEKKALAPLQAVQSALPLNYLDALKALVMVVEDKEKLTLEVAAAQPKIDAYDTICTSDKTITVGEFAKVVGAGRNTMFKILRAEKFLEVNSTMPYQTWISRGLFTVKYCKTKAGLIPQPLITGKGVDYLVKFFNDTEGV